MGDKKERIGTNSWSPTQADSKEERGGIAVDGVENLFRDGIKWRLCFWTALRLVNWMCYSTFFSTIFPRLEIIFSNMSAEEVGRTKGGKRVENWD